MRSIERKILLKRRQCVRKGIPMFKDAIREQYKQAIAMVHTSEIGDISGRIRSSISEDPIRRAFENYYPLAVDFAMMWRKELQPKKGDDDLYYSVYQRTLRKYVTRFATERIKTITETTEDHVIRVVNEAISTGMSTGLSTEHMRESILNALVDDYETMSPARANLIAQTEMVTASNMAAREGANDMAKETSLTLRKFWSTSGIGNSRESHIQAEADSIANNGYNDDEQFSNGLLYPGDPAGSADEVCNCHCSVLYELI